MPLSYVKDMNFPGVLNSSSLRIHLRVEITNAGGVARGHTGRNIGQKSIEISWKSSQKWKSKKSSCRARAAFLLRIAPFTIVNYKADPAAARAHASYSLRPASGDSIMGLWRITTVRDSKGNSSFGSVQLQNPRETEKST